MIVHGYTVSCSLHVIVSLMVASTVLAAISDSPHQNTQDITDSRNSAQEELKKFEEKCTKLGGKDAMKNIEISVEETGDCFRRNFSFTVIKDEVEKAKPEGNLDVVFRKYCGMQQAIINCTDIIIKSVRVCFEKDELYIPDTISAMRDEALKFVCHNEGDRIALFIGSEGPKCVQDKMQDTRNCINETFPGILELNGFAETSVVDMFSEENCRKYDVIHSCWTKELKECDDPTPANMIDSLLLVMKKVTKCASSGSSMVPTVLLVLFTSIVTILSWRSI